MPTSFELTLGRRTGPAERLSEESTKLVLLLEGNNAGQDLRLVRLDLDHFEQIIQAHAPSLRLLLRSGADEIPVNLTFDSMASFEPDAISRQIEQVGALQSLSRQLLTPDSAPQAAAILATVLGAAPAAQAAPDSKSTDLPSGGQDDFSRLLGSDAGDTETPESARVQSFIKGVLADETASAMTTDYSALAELAQLAIPDLVAQVLHHPEFRKLEKTWRGVASLVENVGLDGPVEMSLLPVDFAALADSLVQARDNLRHSELFRVLNSASSGAEGAGFEVIGIDHDFQQADDVEFLSQLCELAGLLNAGVLTNAPDALLVDLATVIPRQPAASAPAPVLQAWEAFRKTPGARRCAVVTPRLLLRSPYGSRGEACDLAGFEELGPRPDHEQFLWGHPVYGLMRLACAQIEGDETTVATLEISDIPMAIFDDGTGGEDIKPPAEVYLSEQDTVALGRQGVMTFLSFRNRNAVKLSEFHFVS